MITLNDAKAYIKVDDNFEDDLIDNLLKSAKEYMLTCGITDKNKLSNLYDLAIKMLVSHWYENREVVGEAKLLAYSLNSIIFKMSLVGDKVEQ